MNETLIFFGDAIKALDDNGRVGGYGVRFRKDQERDVTGEYFTAKTYLGKDDGDGVDVLFHHGIPVSKELKSLSSHIFSSPVKATRDDIGVFVETVLDQSNDYEKAVLKLVKAGKLGWSSGSTARVVRKSADGEIQRWPIVEYSFTHKPAEPLNRAIEIKSVEYFDELLPLPAKATSGSDIFTQNLTEQNQTFWRIENALCESARDIAKAAAAVDITGTDIDVATLISGAVDAYAVKIKSLITAQINDWLESNREHEFYVKSTLLNAVISSGLREGQTFEDRLDTVLAANEKIAADVKAICEMRATKAGAKISKARRERLKEIMSQLESLMTEVEPVEADEKSAKSVDPIDVINLATQFESIKMRRNSAR